MAVRQIGNISINYTIPEAQTQVYNAIGRTTGEQAGQGAYTQGVANPNFFEKRWNSIKNAFGTTGAAIASLFKDKSEEIGNDQMRRDNRNSMNQIAKQYGYNSWSDWQDAFQSAKDAGDATRVSEMEKQLEEFKTQANTNAGKANEKAAAYDDWRKNNYVSQQINQDRGKFAGSAINTVSTMADIALPAAGVAFNSIQGGAEGIADELEQNGLENFDWGRAGQNALIGATTGAVTGALNRGISSKLAKNGGNLFKGSNALTRGLNNAGASTALGRGLSTVATGAGRGAVSGAVGGATGAGLSAALNNGDVLGSAAQGAIQGAQQGAMTGGIMAGANMAISKTPGVGRVMQNLNEAGEDWRRSGRNFNERLTNTLTSGDSAVGNWIQGKPSKFLNMAGNVGDTIKDGNTPRVTTKALGNELEDRGSAYAPKETVKRYLQQNRKFVIDNPEYYDGVEGIVADYDAMLKQLNGMKDDYVYIENNPMAESELHILPSSEVKNNFKNIDADLQPRTLGETETPTTAKGWAKKAGERIVEDLNKSNLGNRIKDEGDTDAVGKLWAKKRNIDLSDVYADPELAKQMRLSDLLQKQNLSLDEFNERNALKAEIYGDDFMPNDTIPTIDARNNAAKYVDDILTGRYKNGSDADLVNAFRQLPAATQNEVLGMGRKWLSDDFMNTLEQSATPTTAKGWIKKAGERAVEDINNSNLGNRVRNVADEYPDDIRNLKINRWDDASETPAQDAYEQGRGSFSDALNEFIEQGGNIARDQDGNMSLVRPGEAMQTTPTTKLDAWDQLAQESGYRTYNDVIQGYMNANPGAKVDAGAVLTWMDNNPGNWNPNQPTTAGGWAKRAGERAVEDINNSALGNRIKNVNQESPETEVYRTLTGRNGESLDGVFEPEARNQIQTRNKLQSLGQQLDNISRQQKYAALYGALNNSTATRAVETNSPNRLAEMGIKPENYLEAAKTSNYVNQVVTDLAKESNVKVNIPDMPQRLEAAADGVVFQSTDAPNKFNRAIRQVIADGTNPDEYSAGYLIEASRDFSSKAAKVRGNSDDAKALREAYTNAKYILRDEAANALANANITGDLTNSKIADGLAKMGANQKVIDYYTENIDGKAPTARDYIRRTSLFEQARDMGTQMDAEKLTRSASKDPTRFSTKLLRATGLEQPLELLLNNTVAPASSLITKGAGKVLTGAGNLAAKVGGGETIDTNTGANASGNVITPRPEMRVYDAIGRTEGLTNAEQARTANYITDATQGLNAESGYADPLAATTATSGNTLESLATPTTGTAATSVYDSLYSQPTQATTQQTAGSSYFPATGDYWTDVLGRALSAAIDAEDVAAFASLYAMYQDAASKLNSSTTESTSSQKLTATQQRANAAMNSLERLSNMTPDFAYNLSSIPVVGNIATLGGNNYESEARSLAQQIGYMVSGSNIKDSEAENIGKSYVPQPWDNEQVRQQKLRRAYEIIQQYQNGYAE